MTQLIGRGKSGRVYATRSHPNLCVKIQSIPLHRTPSDIQHELAIATLAGELGVGPHIHHLAICDSKPGTHTQTVIWVMDRIQGDTIANRMEQYKRELKTQNAPPILIKQLVHDKYTEYVEELVVLLDMLESKGVLLDDVHGNNVMYGTIGTSPPRLWIVDYGKMTFQ